MKSILVSLCLLLLIAGCGPSESTQIKSELFSIGMLYHTFTSNTGGAPSSTEALLDFVDSNGSQPGNKAKAEAMKKVLQSGDYTVYWGYDVTVDKARNEKTILAFHKDTPNKGGLAAFADGTVQSMTADEFNDSAKADASLSEQPTQP